MDNPVFFVCLAEPKAGKSQSMGFRYTHLLTTLVDRRVQMKLLIQATGMRKHMQTSDCHGIIARDECQRFLKDVIYQNKKSSLDATMFILFQDKRRRESGLRKLVFPSLGTATLTHFGDCEEEFPSTNCQSTVGQQLTDKLLTDIFTCEIIR